MTILSTPAATSLPTASSMNGGEWSIPASTGTRSPALPPAVSSPSFASSFSAIDFAVSGRGDLPPMTR